MHPFRFGVFSSAVSAKDLVAQAKRAESLGYDTVTISDHVDLSGAHIARLAAIPALGAVAAATAKVRLGTGMINQDLHLPGVLAREAATLDILSEGRFELGIGAGHTPYENAWAGIAFHDGAVRAARLTEYVRAVKAILASEVEATYVGEFVRIEKMPAQPRPVQRPHPPVMVGGTRRRVLTMAAREADIVSISLYEPGISMDAQAMDDRVAWVREAAAHRADRIELHAPLMIVKVGAGNRDELVTTLRAELTVVGLGFINEAVGAGGLTDAPVAVVGAIEQIADDLRQRRERSGVSYLTVPGDVMDTFAPVVGLLAGT